MMEGYIIRWIIICFSCYGSLADFPVNLTLPKDAYLLKPLTPSLDPYFLQLHTVLTASPNDPTLAIGSGSIETSVRIDNETLQTAFGNESTHPLDGVTAHIIGNEPISSIRPFVDVLFHAPTIEPTCVEAIIKQGNRIITSPIILKGTALAQISLPPSFFSVSTILPVYQTVSAFDKRSSSCLVKPSRKSLIGNVRLKFLQTSYTEKQLGDGLVVHIPQHKVAPGSEFTVSVYSKSNFRGSATIRARAKHGLKILTVENVASICETDVIKTKAKKRNRDEMRVFVNCGQSGHGRSVHVFNWHLRMDNTKTPKRRSHLTLTNLKSRRRNIIEKFSLMPLTAIVPVIKTQELFNTAVLRGKEARWPLRIYKVSLKTGEITDVTQKSQCSSGDIRILNVRKCKELYIGIDPVEANSALVSVEAKYQSYTSIVFVRVWQPELPVGIFLSDSRLSEIKRWKLEKKCNLRYQQTDVKVYTRFFINDDDEISYYVASKAYMDVTHLVQRFLSIKDRGVAVLKRKKNGAVFVRGVSNGRTKLVATSPTEIVLGKVYLEVGEKVTLDKITAVPVSSLSVDIASEMGMHATLAVTIKRRDKLVRSENIASLIVTLHYSDGTQELITDVDPRHIEVVTESDDEQLIRVINGRSSQPLVRGIGMGYGELVTVSVYGNSRCSELPLVKTKVLINVGVVDPQPQRDAAADGGNRLAAASEAQLQNEQSAAEAAAINSNIGNESKRVTSLELGMYILLAVFCIAIVVFAANCFIFVLRYRRGKVVQSSADTTAHDWVWIGRETLERNAIDTRCSRSLLPQEDFNANISTSSASNSTPSSPPTSSNRNSVISTYKGSECSVRITSNPIVSESEEDSWQKLSNLSYHQLMTYFDNLKESTA